MKGKRLGLWLCLGGALLGAIGLAGVLTGVQFLRTLVPGQSPALPNSAMGVIAAGVAGALRANAAASSVRRAVAFVLAFVALTIGVLSLAEHILAVDLGIDQMIPSESPRAAPGRSAIPAALALTLLGLALLTIDLRPRGRIRPSEVFAILAAFVAFAAHAGQLFGASARSFPDRAPIIGLSVPTALSLGSISIGLLVSRPDAGLMRVFTSAGPGGVMFRRMIIPVVIAPIVLGLIVTRLLLANGVSDVAIVAALVVVTTSFVALALVPITAVALDRAHQVLEQERAWIADLVEQASDGIFIADRSGTYAHVNSAGCSMVGRTRDEIIGKPITQLFPSEDHARLTDSRKRLLAGGTVEVSEWRLVQSNGSFLPVEVSAKILRDGRWQAFVRDITRRKEAEDAARRAHDRVEGIISIAADAIVCIDESGRITVFNRGAERMFGWSATEALGQPLEMLVPERMRAAQRATLHRIATDSTFARRLGERPEHVIGQRKDGSEFPAEAAISRLRLDHETTFTVVVHDISERVQISTHERLLAEIGPRMMSSLDRAQILDGATALIVQSIADVCLVDLADAPGETGTLARRCVAHRDPELAAMAHRIHTVRRADGRLSLSWPAIEAQRTTRVSRMTDELYSWLTDDESERDLLRQLAPVSIVTVPLSYRGLLVGALTLISRDPGHRYDEADERLVEDLGRRIVTGIEVARLFALANDAIRVRDEVLKVVAHDLRNPLYAAAVGAKMLMRPDNERRSQAREVISHMQHALDRANRLIDDLVDITRTEAGKQLPITPRPVDLRRLVESVCILTTPRASEASIALAVDIEPDLPPALADEPRIGQVLENLLSNALKFTSRGGHVSIRARRETDHILVAVRDDGPGMTPDQVEHAFDRFWQASANDARGAGLGLAISRAIVEAHHGQIWATSVPGAGSTFWFTLPTAEELDHSHSLREAG